MKSEPEFKIFRNLQNPDYMTCTGAWIHHYSVNTKMIDKRLKIFRCQNIRALSIQTTFKAFFLSLNFFTFAFLKGFLCRKCLYLWLPLTSLYLSLLDARLIHRHVIRANFSVPTEQCAEYWYVSISPRLSD